MLANVHLWAATPPATHQKTNPMSLFSPLSPRPSDLDLTFHNKSLIEEVLSALGCPDPIRSNNLKC
jgi:hypothetical protein